MAQAPAPSDARRQASLTRLRGEHHPHCLICAAGEPSGVGLEFRPTANGAVEASFCCDRRLQGYPDRLHGGAVAAVLDGAMTNCLFAAGTVAVTAELQVRYRRPVRLGVPATVRAWAERSLGALHWLRAEIRQDGTLAAHATGKFMASRPALQGAAAAE